MKHYCSVCHTVHEGRCERPVQTDRRRNSEADRFRNRKVWRRKADSILERDRYCCRMCLKVGIINSRELSVHHIIPLVSDFSSRLDDSNLITLCRFHHEQAERGHIHTRELLNLASDAVKLPEL